MAKLLEMFKNLGMVLLWMAVAVKPSFCRLIADDNVEVFMDLFMDSTDVQGESAKLHTEEKISFIPIRPRSLFASLDSADHLTEWTPVSNQIGINETQFYEFVVNTTHTGVGEYYEILVFISGNICELPDDLSNSHSADNQLEVYYSYNQSDMYDLDSLTTAVDFEEGYMQALAENPTADPYSNLYLAVRAPYTTDNITGTWNYEIGISQNDLVFQWDDRSWADLVDSDGNSALFITGNLSSSGGALSNGSLDDSDIYKLHVYSYSYKDYFVGLNRSWCAINNGPSLIEPDTMETQITTNYGNLKQQFYVKGLNSSTKYIAYLTQDFSGSGFGGAVFQQFEFETLDDGVCQLIYDLSFCTDVAYSVPAASGFFETDNSTYYDDKSAVAALYDNYTEGLYANFAKAIQVVACDDELDSRYSPIRTCSDCKTSYKQWLCSVSIPRCSTRNVTGYKYRDIDDSRNDFINDVVVPPAAYFEMLPCVNMCHAIVRDCAPDFGFACPTQNSSIALSYYWDEPDSEYTTCNYFGDSSSLESNSAQTTSTVTSFANLAAKLDFKALVVAFSLQLMFFI